MSYMVEGLQGTPVSLGGSGIPASPRGLSGRLEALARGRGGEAGKQCQAPHVLGDPRGEPE